MNELNRFSFSTTSNSLRLSGVSSFLFDSFRERLQPYIGVTGEAEQIEAVFCLFLMILCVAIFRWWHILLPTILKSAMILVKTELFSFIPQLVLSWFQNLIQSERQKRYPPPHPATFQIIRTSTSWIILQSINQTYHSLSAICSCHDNVVSMGI